ncbi:MAG: mannose-1-phosphate guanylyltransferase [Armatimonadetes bacterium]|nr:mannose-1-phosphate guanylyltransferase [Armatimonadota bacterium]
MYAVIMAGGSGTRLWPMSRKSQPKQFQRFGGDQTMIQATVARVLPMVSYEKLYISTIEPYVEIIREQLPEVPPEHYIIEPHSRNTAPAMALIATTLARIDPEATIATIASDHLVTRPDNFRQALQAGAAMVKTNPEYIATIGLKPDRPHTGFGYIRVGDPLHEAQGMPVYRVRQFVEKPDLKTAEAYLAAGDYLWNASYFIWNAQSMLRALGKHQPDIARRLGRIEAAWHDRSVLDEEYRLMPAIAIDYVIEQLPSVLVVPADLGWDDVGSWANLYDILARESPAKNIEYGHHIGIDDENCLIFANAKLIATIGLKNLVIVDTPDAIFIADKDRSQDVKSIVERLKSQGEEEYL